MRIRGRGWLATVSLSFLLGGCPSSAPVNAPGTPGPADGSIAVAAAPSGGVAGPGNPDRGTDGGQDSGADASQILDKSRRPNP